MAPRHTQGCGGRHIVRRRISRAQQTKNWCVGFSFPPPAYAGIHPTLYLFGFRANAHSPLICLALIRSLVSSASGALGEASGSSRLPVQGFGGFGALSFLGCQPCSCLANPEISAFPGRPVAPQSAQQKIQKVNNLVNHRKGEGVP